MVDPSQPRADPAVKVLKILLILLVLTQRIGIPLGGNNIAVAIPLAYIGIAVLVFRHRVAVSRLRAELLLLAAIGVFATTAVAAYRGEPLSITSLLLLMVIYVPWILHGRDMPGETVQELGRTFVRLMTVLAIVGVVQLAVQLAGVWEYEDYLSSWLGPSWINGDYSFSNPLVYGSTSYKANAFLMLEPSFFSQYCAVAVIVGVLLRARAWQLLVLVAGLASAVSGTGIILLIVGVILLVFRATSRLRAGHVVAAAIALGLVLLSPVAPLLLSRSGETSQPGSSGYLRFVQPYAEVVTGLMQDPVRFAVGAGPGTAERLLASYRDGLTAEAVTYTIVPKLVFEYGLVAGGMFVLFILITNLDRTPWRVVPGVLVFMTFLLSGALLQPQTAFLVWLLTGFWTANEAHDGRMALGAPPPAGRRLETVPQAHRADVGVGWEPDRTGAIGSPAAGGAQPEYRER